MIVKAGAIHRDGTTVIIQGTETTMDEVFVNVKIDAGQTTSELDMSQAVCGEGVTYLGRTEKDERSAEVQNSLRKVDVTESVKLEDTYNFEKKDKTGIISLSGTAKAGMGISVAVHITKHHQKIDFTVNESLNMDITAKVNLKENINLFTVPFSPIPAIHIKVSLVIPIEVNAKITVAVDVNAQQGFSYDTDAGFQSLTKSPDVDASVEIEGKLYVGLRLGITGAVLDEELLSLSLYGEVGEEFSASNTQKEDSDFVKHDCLLCLDGDITLKAGLYAKLNIVKIIDNKVFPLMETSCHQGDFYYCMDRNEFGFGNCPYRRFKVTFTVQDNWDFTGLEGAKVNGDNITDKSGNAVCYLSSGNYKYPIEMNGYQTKYQEFSVEDVPKRQIFWLKKDGSHENPDNPDDDKDYMKAYYEILDMFYYNIGAGWKGDGTEDVSYLWWAYGPKALSEAGYCFKDLDGNGIPELFVSSLKSNEYGMFEDLYTYMDGKVIHLVSSGERDQYYLCDDNMIYNEGSGGAELSSWTTNHLNSEKKSLTLDEVLVYDSGLYYYGTEECSDDYYGYDYNLMKIISSEEAVQMQDKFNDKLVDLDLTLFDAYTPKGENEKPDDFTLRKAFREAIGSENVLYFRADDYDKNGMREAFGITGNYNGEDAENIKVYFINHNGQVSFIDEIEELWGAKYDFEENNAYLILDTGLNKFLRLRGITSATTLYSVKGGSAYQPEVSGKYAEFYKTENGTYNGDGHEGPGYRYIYEYNSATGEFDYIDREWVGGGTSEGKDANAGIFSHRDVTRNLSVTEPNITENPNRGTKTAVFTDLLPNEQYNFYVMYSSESDNKFSKDNLFYIRQAASDGEGRLSIEYTAEHIPDDAQTFVVGKTRTDISDAQVSVPKLVYNGQEQYVQPVITLDNRQLVEGTDYELSGTYSVSEVGSYRVVISGIGMYTGVIYSDYQIVEANQDPDEDAALKEAKNKAKLELNAYKNLDDYREEQKKELIKAIADGKIAIDSAKDEAGVTKALSDAKEIMDKIKTDAQLTEEEKTRINISQATVTLSQDSCIYDGTSKTPDVTVTLNGTALSLNIDYIVSYNNNTNIGMATVTVTGIGNYMGTVAKNFEIYKEGEDAGNPCVHQYVWITDKFPTQTEEGSKHLECLLCGDKIAFVKIPKIASSNNNGKNVSDLGTIYLDAASEAIYKITKDDANDRTASYLKTKVAFGTLAVPDSIQFQGKTFNVTEISDGASFNNMQITKVIIGNNVTSVGQGAFSGCSKLKTVTIGKAVTSIGKNAFFGCSQLKTVAIGKNVTSIKSKAFSRCVSLKQVVIPSKVKNIGSKVFYGCSGLKKLTIKTTKLTGKSIGSKAFSGVSKKVTVKVPKSKLKSYKKLLKKKGIGKKAKVN